ncbi:MAG: lysylphosphatidylglycerol synthase transmembrane domain-containing protein [Gammaproteobacteria bacterium]
MKSWQKWLGTGVGLLLIGYFLIFLLQTLETHDLDALLKPGMALAILAAALVCALLIPLAGFAWSILLHSMGCNWKPAKLTAIIGFTQLAKYVPGNIAQHIGRTTAALVNGMPPSMYLSSVVAETILLLIASLLVGVLSMSLSSTPIPLVGIPLTETAVSFAAILATSLILFAIVLRYSPSLLRWFANAKGKTKLTIPIPSKLASTQAFGLYCIAYLLLGVALCIIAKQHGGLVEPDFFTLPSSFALAWLAGYLAPGVPAGLGVREGAMAILLSNAGPSEYILTVIVAARLATIIADAISFLLSIAIMKSSNVRTGTCP